MYAFAIAASSFSGPFWKPGSSSLCPARLLPASQGFAPTAMSKGEQHREQTHFFRVKLTLCTWTRVAAFGIWTCQDPTHLQGPPPPELYGKRDSVSSRLKTVSIPRPGDHTQGWAPYFVIHHHTCPKSPLEIKGLSHNLLSFTRA